MTGIPPPSHRRKALDGIRLRLFAAMVALAAGTAAVVVAILLIRSALS